MDETKSTNDGTPQPDKQSLPVSKIPSFDNPIEAVKPPTEAPVVQQSVASKLPNQIGDNNEAENTDPVRVRLLNEPLMTRAVRDNDLGAVDIITVRYARYGIFVAILTLIVASITGYFFYGQFQEMANQTDLSARAAKQGRIDAKDARTAIKQQLFFAQQQTQAAQNSVAAVQRQMREDQRAWLQISMGNVSWSEGKPISIPVVVTNVGKTAARKFSGEIVVKNVDNTLSGGRSITFNYSGVPRTLDSSGYVLPNDPVSLIARSEEVAADKKTAQVAVVSHEDAIKLGMGQEFIIFYAEAKYIDIFGVNHWTRLCKFSSPSGKDAYASKCTNYSDVDNN